MNGTVEEQLCCEWEPLPQWKIYEHDYISRKKWLDTLFKNMIQDAIRLFDKPTVLDIGCGHGIAGSVLLQSEIAEMADKMWGCEPDTSIQSNSCFHQVFPNTLEESAIPKNSVHVAYSCFVIEHIPDPVGFFTKIHECLVEGGIFLGITDYRWSFFSTMSQIMEWTRLKELYLNLLRGQRGKDRYENYPTYYRANTAGAVKSHAPLFSKHYFAHWHQYGELNYYLPKALRPFGWGVDAISMAGIIPRQIFLIGLQK